jgi:hypothetical protein
VNFVHTYVNPACLYYCLNSFSKIIVRNESLVIHAGNGGTAWPSCVEDQQHAVQSRSGRNQDDKQWAVTEHSVAPSCSQGRDCGKKHIRERFVQRLLHAAVHLASATGKALSAMLGVRIAGMEASL